MKFDQKLNDISDLYLKILIYKVSCSREMTSESTYASNTCGNLCGAIKQVRK